MESTAVRSTIVLLLTSSYLITPVIGQNYSTMTSPDPVISSTVSSPASCQLVLANNLTYAAVRQQFIDISQSFKVSRAYYTKRSALLTCAPADAPSLKEGEEYWIDL